MSWFLGITGLGTAGLLDPRSDAKRAARRTRAARKKALRQAHLQIAEAYAADVWATPVRSEGTSAAPDAGPAGR